MFGSMEWHFLIIGAVVGSLVTTICCKTLTCYGEVYSGYFPFDHLPLPQCFVPQFRLYTNANKAGLYISKTYTPTAFATWRKTVFIIHGYRSSADRTWVTAMRDALLNRDYFNVITVDWEDYADMTLFQPYEQAAANTRVCAKGVADLLKSLKLKGLAQSLSHCIGHSLGAHTCGQAGQREKFGRISGLDPAGPQFTNPIVKPIGNRLSSDDADFVDAIHTDGGSAGFGTFYPAGHVDFYPNGGGPTQPGCNWIAAIDCSHSRVLDLYTASISSSCFKSRHKCTNYNNAFTTKKKLFGRTIVGSCTPCAYGTSFCQVMGYDAIFYSGRGWYYLETNSASQFCRN